MSKVKHDTREAWLVAGAETMLADVLRPHMTGYEKPKYRVSVGWPYRGKANTIGQCFTGKVSKDASYELFISPKIEEPVRALDILVHELIHAVVGTEAGHKAPFKKVAVAIGLTGKMTATTAGEELLLVLQGIADELGPYPHASLLPTNKVGKQKTYLLKAVCAACGYTVRVTQKWADMGMPTCPCGTEMEEGQ